MSSQCKNGRLALVLIFLLGALPFFGISCSCREMRLRSTSSENRHSETRDPEGVPPSLEQPDESRGTAEHPDETPQESGQPGAAGSNFARNQPGKGGKEADPRSQNPQDLGDSSGRTSSPQAGRTPMGLILAPDEASANRMNPQVIFQEASAKYRKAQQAARRGQYALAYQTGVEAWQLLQSIRETNREATSLRLELEASLSNWADQLGSSSTFRKPLDSKPLITR